MGSIGWGLGVACNQHLLLRHAAIQRVVAVNQYIHSSQRYAMWHFAWITYSNTLYRCTSATPNPRDPLCIRNTGKRCSIWGLPQFGAPHSHARTLSIDALLPIITSDPTCPASKDVFRPFPLSMYTNLAFTPLHFPAFLALFDRLKYRRLLFLRCRLRSHPPTPILQLGQDFLFR